MSAGKKYIAIAGNPNSGKTTAFNMYTGAHQHVGNYPGITVEKKIGTARVNNKEVTLVDLPGTYSLTAYSLEEVVAREVLAEERPGAVINVINSVVLERNLYLTVQLREMGVPVVLALNMIDEAKAQHIDINVKKLEELMNVRVVPTVARTGEGLNQALEVALDEAEKQEKWNPLRISYGPDVDATLEELEPIIEKNGILSEKYPARWVALKVIENDSDIHKQVKKQSPELLDKLSAITDKLSRHLSMTLNSYPEAIIAEYRYGYITSLLKQGVVNDLHAIAGRVAYSDKIDKVVTNKFLGPIILLSLLYLMYFITFQIGDYPKVWVEDSIGWIRDSLDSVLPDSQLKSLLLSGVIDGVGGVLGFVPLIAIMFFLIAFLEDTGYIARAAYMLDRIFRMFGLHGASVMPFIVSGGIAGGCAVPGVMAARTLRSPRERLATILTSPFMACGAKLPVFILFVGIFYPENKELAMFLLTVVGGWSAALIVSFLLRNTIIKGESTPFVMELPPYRLPTLNGLLIHTWERIWMYLKKAGTIILAISIILWAAMNYPALSDEKAEEFSKMKAPFEKQLETYPLVSLKNSLDKIEEQLSELPSSDPNRKNVEKQKESLQEEFDALPVLKLKSQIDELDEQLESLNKSAEIDSLIDNLNSTKEKVERTENADKKATIEQKITELKDAISTTPYGKIYLEKSALEEKYEALPEVTLQTQIDDIAHQESSEVLRNSFAGRIGTAIEPISKYAGFDWKTNIALVAGIAAKEVVVSTLGTAYSLGDVDPEDGGSLSEKIASDESWSKANATALLLFTLLYSPCFVTIVMIRQETGRWSWAIFSIIFNLLLAFGVAVVANQLLLSV